MMILYDTVKLRPGCPILQAAAGCDPALVMQNFESDTWLTTPTLDLKVYPLSGPAQLSMLAKITHNARTAP